MAAQKFLHNEKMNTENFPLVSIIIVSHNGMRFLKDCFDTLTKIDYPSYEVLFVDNGSTDESVDFISQGYPSVKIIRNKENLGFTIANNNASYIARGEYLFFLNNDTRVDANVVSKLIARMQEDPAVGICACKLMSYDGAEHFHTGVNIDIFGYPIVNNDVFYSEGSSLFIRKSLFHQLGGFDERYLFFHEEIDLAWRCWLMGYRVVAVPEAIVYHRHGASAGGSRKENRYSSTLLRRYLSERNNIRTLLKNYSLRTLFTIVPRYILLNLGEILILLLNLQFKAALCYPKAYGWNIINIADTLEKRRQVNRFRRISDKEIMQRMYKGSAKFSMFKRVGIPTFAQNTIHR